MNTDTIAAKATPKVNRAKGKDVQIGQTVPMVGTDGYTWAEVATITREGYMSAQGAYRFTSTEGLTRVVSGNEFVQIHS